MKISLTVLIISLLVAIGSWMGALGSWNTALQPDKLGSLAFSIASVLGAAFGVNKADFTKSNSNGNSNVIKFPPPPASGPKAVN